MDVNERYYAWRKRKILRYELTLNRTLDADLVEHIELQENKRAYLKGLIRKDIEEKHRIIAERKEKKER